MIFYVTVLSEAPAGQGAGPAPAFPLYAPDPYAASRMGQQAADDLSGVGPQHFVGVGSISGADSGGMLSYGDMMSNSGMLHPQDLQSFPQQPSQMAQPLMAQPQMVSPAAMPPYTVEMGPDGQMQQMSIQNGQNMQLQPPPLPHHYPHMQQQQHQQPMQQQPMHQPMQHQPMQHQPMQHQPMQHQSMQHQPMQHQLMQQPLQWGMLEDDIAGSSQAMPASGLAEMPLLARQNGPCTPMGWAPPRSPRFEQSAPVFVRTCGRRLESDGRCEQVRAKHAVAHGRSRRVGRPSLAVCRRRRRAEHERAAVRGQGRGALGRRAVNVCAAALLRQAHAAPASAAGAVGTRGRGVGLCSRRAPPPPFPVLTGHASSLPPY